MDEEALIAWQDVLETVANKRSTSDVACPYCSHRPLTIEEVENENSTRISCSKCGKFIQGRFQ